MWINLGNLSAGKDPNLVRCKLSDPGARTNSQFCSASFVELCQLFVAICCNLVPTKITLQFEHPHIFGFWAPKVPCRNPEIDSTITTTTNDSRVIPGTLNNGTLMVSFLYYSHIFRDSYGSGMGIVWEAYHKGVPWLGVPENPIEWWIGICSLLRYALSKLASDFRASCINGTSHTQNDESWMKVSHQLMPFTNGDGSQLWHQVGTTNLIGFSIQTSKSWAMPYFLVILLNFPAFNGAAPSSWKNSLYKSCQPNCHSPPLSFP